MECCPHCGVSWLEDQTIYEYFLAIDPENATRKAEMYGPHPQYFSQNVFGVVYKDRVVEWQCLNCEARIDSFTGEIKNALELLTKESQESGFYD